jgi:hypothetical protein
MANPASGWEGLEEDASARTLRVAGEQERRVAEFCAKVSAVGETWAGSSRSAGLTELLCAAAAGDPELARLARAGGQLLEAFVEGLSRTAVVPPSSDLAADLIDGRRLPQDVLDRLAAAYVVVLARRVEQQQDHRAPDFAGHTVLSTRRSGVLVLLVPAGDSALLDRITGQLVQESWVSTASGPVTALEGVHAEAAEVLRLVVAGRRPAGVYTMTDVLVEHAITSNDSVATRLTELIRPLRENQMLWETLVALISADFNRNQAARELFIHRSTLDYRLQRIAKVTGCDPASGRGARLLSAALIADAVV